MSLDAVHGRSLDTRNRTIRRIPTCFDCCRANSDGDGNVLAVTVCLIRALIAVLFASGARLSQTLALHTAQLIEPGLRLDERARQWIAEYVSARGPWYADMEAIFISHGPKADGQQMSVDSAERTIKVADRWLADQRSDEGADPDEVETLRAVSAESIRRFLDEAKRAAADQFFPRADLTDAHCGQEHP